MEDYEDILNRDNTCLFNIDSQAIAALHNIEYENSARKQKPSNYLKEADNHEKKRKPSSLSAGTSKKFRKSQSPARGFPVFEEESPVKSKNDENDSFLWNFNSDEIAMANNVEYDRLKKTKSSSSQNTNSSEETSKALPFTRSKTFPKIKSQDGIYRTVDISSSPAPTPGTSRRKEKLSVSSILDCDNTFLLEIDCDKIAADNNIDITTPNEKEKPPDENNEEDLTQLTQCLVNSNEQDGAVVYSQVQQCVGNFSQDEAMEIVENQNTAAVFIKRKEKTKVHKTESNFCGLTPLQKKFVLHTKGINDLYDWQYECLALPTVRERKNLIYALPTSGGKSLVAEFLILRELLVHKKNAVLILPFVSIVQEKIQDFVPFALHFNFLVEEYCAGKGPIPPTKRREKNSLYIATIEKCQILVDSLIESNRINEIGIVVIDELHMIGGNRGHSLELLISKFMYMNASELASIQVIGMSATIENLSEVAKFVDADLYCRDFRPIELKEYIKMGENLFYIDPKAKSITDTFKLETANFGGDVSPVIRQRDPDLISVLVMETISKKSSCLVFCSSKKSCENVALLLADVLPRDLLKVNREEKKSLIETIKMDAGGKMCEVLQKTIPFGVTYHHSGLTADERRRIEDAFRAGVINVICCTSTLAAGVNLPAGRVIIRSPNIGREFIPLSTYKQMIGRAGRAGKSEIGDSIMICNRNDHQQVISLLTSRMELTVSNYIIEPSHFYSMVLNLISNKLVNSYSGIVNFLQYTFAYVQRDSYDRDVFGSIKDVIISLYLNGAIDHRAKSNGECDPAVKFKNNQGKNVYIYPYDELTISKVGQAAVNSNKSLEEAQELEKDLRKANESLVLSQPLHLLYIVAPRDVYTSINVNYRTFSELFFEMERVDKSVIKTASVLGISMGQVSRMMKTSNITESLIPTIKRFYVAMMLFNLWNGEDVFDVARNFKVDRGMVSKLMTSASSEAYSIFKFCEVFDEFWVFKEILENFSRRLQYCCSAELLPLMELPGIKVARAKMLYNAGIKTIMDVAALTPEQLTQTIKFINTQQAAKVIKAAKYALKAEFDDNREKLLVMKDVLNKKAQ